MISRFGDELVSVIDGWSNEDTEKFAEVLKSPLVRKALGALEEHANEIALQNATGMNLLSQEGVMAALKRQSTVAGMKMALEFLASLGEKEDGQPNTD